jgi:hypothetical protein
VQDSGLLVQRQAGPSATGQNMPVSPREKTDLQMVYMCGFGGILPLLAFHLPIDPLFADPADFNALSPVLGDQ